MGERKFVYSLLLVIVSIFTSLIVAQNALAVAGHNGGDNNTTNVSFTTVLVKFKSNTSTNTINNILAAGGCSSSSPSGSPTGSLSASSPVNGWVLATITNASGSNRLDVEQTVNFFINQSLQTNSSVLSAEANQEITIALTPNDPSFVNGSLWGLDDAVLPDADISAVTAWDFNTGSNIVIAVADSGLDYLHEDIVGNVWINPGEIAGNNIDDDLNGFIDDTIGWDWVNLDNDPLDDNGHGTHVSGTIAAVGNNAIGVTGVNWTAQIMPLKFISAGGAGTVAGAVAAIDYAVANGANIINASWGGGVFSQTLFDAITAADVAGVLFVAAAGNSGVNTDLSPTYPASFDIPNIISVAATDDADIIATFSNFGAITVDLGAPGVGILSTTLANTYSSFSGTSMASPHVAGAAGLVLTEAVLSGAVLTVADLKSVILNNVDPNASLATTVTGGRLNAFNAVASVAAAPPIVITPFTATTFTGAAFAVTFSGVGGSGSYTWTVDLPTVASVSPVTGVSTVLTGLSPGTVILTATDIADTTIVSSTGPIIIYDSVVSVTAQPTIIDINTTSQLTVTGGSGSFVWSVSPPLGIVNPATNVFAAGATTGIATITAADVLNAAVSGSTTITIVDPGMAPPPANIIVTAPAATVNIGAILQISATGGTAPYTFEVIDLFPTTATINAITGQLTGQTVGIVDVVATDANGYAGFLLDIVVTDPTATLILAPNTAVLNIGDTQTFTVTNPPGGGGMRTTTWTVTNTNVASIVSTAGGGGMAPAAGLLTALAPGVTLVTATITRANGNIIASGSTSIVRVLTPAAATGPNSPPTEPLLISPANGARVGKTVELVWAASTDPDNDIVTYQLSFCESADFSTCSPTIVAGLDINNPSVLLAMSGAGGMFFIGLIGFGIRRSVTLKLSTLAILALFLVACSGGGSITPKDPTGGILNISTKSTTDVSTTISGLNRGSTYYWKVVADDGNGGLTSSAVRSFKTR